MIISKSRNFAFIHLEKCGGTSVEVALEPYLAWDDIILGSTDFGIAVQIAYEKRYRNNPLGNLLSKHSSAQGIRDYLADSYMGMYKFAVVRNPVDLVTSLYFYSKRVADDFLEINNIDKDNLIEWSILNMPDLWKRAEVYLMNYILSEIDGSKINGFIKRMLASKHSSITPQTWRLTEDVDIYDLSKLDESWDLILKKIGIKEKVELEHRNKSSRHSDIVISKESIAMIKEHFKDDYSWIPERVGVSWDG